MRMGGGMVLSGAWFCISKSMVIFYYFCHASFYLGLKCGSGMHTQSTSCVVVVIVVVFLLLPRNYNKGLDVARKIYA